MTRRVLVTGFEPFGGETVNPALEAVKLLDGCPVDGYEDTVIVAERIPTVFGKSIETLRTAIERTSPDVVICVGQAGGRMHITPERVAINVDDSPATDNEGNQPIDAPIVVDGPAAYFTKLPIKRMVESMRAAGIPAAVSNTAGTYVCNHIFYGLMNLLDTKYPGIRGGFIHIPYMTEQVVSKNAPSMSLADIVRGLKIAVSEAVLAEVDIVVVGGRES